MIDWSKAISAAAVADEARAIEVEAIRIRRDEAINSGVNIAGMRVGTDDKSQTRIMGAAFSATLDPHYSVAWKMTDGSFVTLSGTQVIAAAQAVRAHVQACFDREADLLTAHASGGAYDLEAGWPVHDVTLADSSAIVRRIAAGVYRVETLLANWTVTTPDGFTATTSHDGEALTVWVKRGGIFHDIPDGLTVQLQREG